MSTKTIAISETGRKWLLVVTTSLVVLAAGYSISQAMGMGGFGGGWGHMGGSGYGSIGQMGHDRYRGHMMNYGPGVDRHFEDGQRSYNRGFARQAPRTVNITRENAANIVRDLFSGNPNLKVGKITESEDGFEVRVLTRKGEALVDRLLVERGTGAIHRIYE